MGFTDYYEKGEMEPSFPIWKNIHLEAFHREQGFDLEGFLREVVEGFRGLLEVEELINEAFLSLREAESWSASNPKLKTIALLDTEYEGTGVERRMTELAIINVAYDAELDAVVGILGEYRMNAGDVFLESAVRNILDRADFVVAHNAYTADRPLLIRYFPEAERMNWLCSYRGIEWKQLIGIQSGSLEKLTRKAGLRNAQDHTAYADACDLKDLLIQRHNGRTFLARLLDSALKKTMNPD